MAMSKKMSAPNNVNNTEDSEEENDTAQAKVASLKLIQSTHNIEDFPLKVPSKGKNISASPAAPSPAAPARGRGRLRPN